MSFNTIKFSLRGTDAMLQHNDRLANPLDEHTKAIRTLHKEKSRLGRGKNASEEEAERVLEEIFKVEWYGGTYYADDIGFYVPWKMIRACLNGAAKQTRDGKKIERGVSSTAARFPLTFNGSHLTIDEVWEEGKNRDVRIVRVGAAKVPRCRPVFFGWEFDCEIMFDSGVIGRDELIEFMQRAGRSEGIGDGRKLGFGRFTVHSVDGKRV